MKRYIKQFMLFWTLMSIVLLIQNETFAKEIVNKEPFKLLDTKLARQRILKTFNESDSIALKIDRPITGLSISGAVFQKDFNGFVRVILEDKFGKEYVVLETTRMYNDVDTIILKDYCWETINLDKIVPIKLRVYTNSSILNITEISYKEERNYDIDDEGKSQQTDISKIRLEQVKRIVENINNYNNEHQILWRADVTELSLLPWDNKKKMLGMDASCAPNGFEYYSSGIFEIGEAQNDEAIIEEAKINIISYADNFDWRNRHGKNWMTSVKHQGTGGSCWAFAAIGVTESLVNLYFNRLLDLDLSEQEIVSCSGCGSNASGGSPNGALNWIANNGVSEEASFPFSNSDEPCSNKGSYHEHVYLNGCSNVTSYYANNYSNLKKALIKYGPMISGFTYFPNNGYVSHAMTLVGYATLHSGDTIRYFYNNQQSPINFDVIQNGDNRIGKTYWIFKNSYGTDFAFEHNGYSYILFNNTCMNTPYYAMTPVSSLNYSDLDINITDTDGDGYYFWGIGNKPLHCPSWIPDDPDGDDSNYSYGPMDIYGNLYDLSAHVNDSIIIETDEIWDVKKFIYNNIIIPNGVTLTIKNELTFYEGSKITLIGGTLCVDGGILQNATIDVMDNSNSKILLWNDGQIERSANSIYYLPKGSELEIESGFIE